MLPRPSSREPPEVVVVGCPSLDRVVLGGRPSPAVGGAAWITALAAHRAGARVGLVALVPRELPPAIGRAFGPGGLDRAGLTTVDGELPSFHIVYGADQRATYVSVEGGAEARLTADHVPEAWLGARIVHLGALAGSTALQLRLADGLRARGFAGLLSAGTWPDAVRSEPERVAELLLRTDFFFLNRDEAEVLLPDGPPRTHRGLVCVTAGADGVVLWGGARTALPARAGVEVVDPTGAGDAFCGAFLGATARGLDGAAAGLAIAAEALGGLGGEPLAERVAAEVAPRAVVDGDRVNRVAAALNEVAGTAALDFAGGPRFPEVGDPLAAAIFGASTLHQYGFWEADDRGWTGPMYAVAGGQRYKGSDFVWQAFTQAAAADPTVLDPRRMAAEPDLVDRICSDDDGRCPLPDLASHRALHRACGEALLERYPDGWTGLIDRARAADRPAPALLRLLAELPGYREDPLAKKANLLVLILAARPERLLRPFSPDEVQPIVDYHLMRGCLRTGCVVVADPELRRRIEERRWVDEVEEGAVRAAAREAISGLVERSGRTVGEVDGFFFSLGRSVCLEVQPPRCDACPASAACGRHVALFQPIRRTTAY